MVGRLLGHYRVLAKVGEGAMGEVYRARDERLERDVAVKVLPAAVAADPDRLARFEREAKALARLAHPNILTIHDFGVEPGEAGPGSAPTAYAVTELLTGETLRARLQQGPLPPGRAVEIGTVVAAGLAAAHAQGIVHRDIKPENLYLTADGRVKILDFGIARLVEADVDATSVATRATEAGLVLGTVGYMAPEQLRGLPVDFRADLFGLGCVLYEMLSGRRAFEGQTPVDTMSAVLHDQPPPLRGVIEALPAGLQGVVERCLQKQPEGRYESAQDLARALEAVRVAPRAFAELTPSSARRAALAPASPDRPSIVVLPFLDFAAARDQEYFCDGLAEELTNRLTHLRGLRVVSRTSAFAFKGKSTDAREIGRQLDVGSLLEGSVQRAGDRVRVRVQLTNVSDGCQAWSERFDRPAGDIFAIEDEIAQAVVTALRVKLLGDAEERAVRGRATDPSSHDLYLRGRNHAARRSFEELERACRCFEQAVDIDPDYAAAHAGIAECQCVIGFIGAQPPRDVFRRGRAAAERALAIDPGLAEAHAVLGHELGMHEWRWEEAEGHFLRALELNPGYALTRTWYSHLLTASGRFDEAIAHTERACECDPLAPTVHMTLGLAFYYARDYERAVDRYLKVLAMDPSFGLARFHLGRAYLIQGRWGEAIEQFEAVAPAIPVALGTLASACRHAGLHERADRAVSELENLSLARYIDPLAWAAATSHDPEANHEWLRRAFDEHVGALPLLNAEPLMDALRSVPAYRALFDRLGLPRVERSAP
jgi:eukaryotic-like serine/threonine-protein kinase